MAGCWKRKKECREKERERERERECMMLFMDRER
jgi:hypothetical protein